jgi:murein DD-endopeptidase MepM/ murein hydrolase activator NlpD
MDPTHNPVRPTFRTAAARIEDRPLASPAAQFLGLFIPAFAEKRVAILNLDVEARAFCRTSPTTDPRSFADAKTCSEFVDKLHARLDVDASFGGYMEDRSFLWQGTYLGGSGHELHLGIDYNVPAGSPVAVPFSGEVLLCDDDIPEPWGWGPRVFIETTEAIEFERPTRYVYAFAHLAGIRVRRGQTIEAGTEIAVVGAPPTNGGWFPHLHVQKIRGEVFDHYCRVGLESLDGYGSTQSHQQNLHDFPDPFSFLLDKNRRR